MVNEREIKVTRNYGCFKRLEGNREISKQRRAAILDSIREHGYVGAPILVNENMEVIDGQGRLAACEELNIPVPYCVKEGTDISTCMVLNRNTRNWTEMDYVKSYAEQGSADYRRILSLVDGFGLSVQATCFAATGKQISSTMIRKGAAKVSEANYSQALINLNLLFPLIPYIQKAGAHTQKLEMAIIYAIAHPSVDYDRLKFAIMRRYHELAPFSRMEDLLDEISRIYNYGLKGADKRIYLKTDYQKEQYEN